MKGNKIIPAALAVAALAITGCYDSYIKDYEYSGVYLAYQYDLRSFVVGEGMQFKIGAALGGVIDNKRDRNVWYAFEDNLLTDDLSQFVPSAESAFTAMTEMTGKTAVGAVSQDYVKTDMNACGITALTPLPQDAIQIPEGNKFTIKKGYHTGTITVKADSAAFLALPGASANPYYALGFHITSADADTILLSRSYEIIAVKYESMLFGYWYHGGKTTITDSEGNMLHRNVYNTEIPAEENTHQVYTLTTSDPYSVTTDYIGTESGSVTITLKDGKLSVASDKAGFEDLGSEYNNAKLLQNRKIFLKYSYQNTDGNKAVVTDTLTFRNRIRDGVNEWQDENPEHYK